jgi:hypothetical protein
MAATRKIIETLQSSGENVLMDHLVGKKKDGGPKETTVSRILDVLFQLRVAKVEELRGRENRPSRAYAYRTGYALGQPIPIHEIRKRLEGGEENGTAPLTTSKRSKSELD